MGILFRQMFLLFILANILFCTGFGQFRNSNNGHYANLHNRYPNIPSKLLQSGLTAYERAKSQGILHQNNLTLVDYSKPSNERRMWVINLSSDRLLFEDYVAHGSASGDRFATRFSNRPGSHESSYGVFLTEAPYMGSHGLSLRLKGLEKGINDKAESRAIVIHSAWYANDAFAKKYGRLGRSWGCFAVSTKLIKPLIQTIKNGNLLVAYYPNRYWLNHSNYIN